ncbi:MAG: S41 family peptidase [Rhodospirillales bacterium]|nr:S41 family peptidase [Rhodospirillales bacterium]MBO6785577.1 S41 family peptidase [Rhodospirillales bacterium]
MNRMISTLGAATLALGMIAWSVPAFAVDAKKNDEETYRLLSLFGDVFERVRAEYVEPPSEEEMIEAAITGMLAALDPHSSYMNAKTYKEMKVNTSGEFGGLGIRVSMEAGFVKVISPIDDTPAFRAGIEAGDLITHLDGESVQGLTLAQAVDRMRGKVGSDIRLTVVREGREPFDVTITRAIVKIASVRSRAEGKIGYVRITSFTEQTDQGLDRAMKKLKDEIGDDIQGYVLDLRNNPGGLLDQAIAVSDAFLDRGEIVSTRSRKPEDTQRFNAREGDLAGGLPVVVLINGGSASASEIVAGALQDHRRAVLMGTKSFGKGSVQTIMPLASGSSAMRLTTARYYTPSGRSIQAKGVDPDIEVKQAKLEEIKSNGPSRSEADLRGALDTEGKETPDPEKTPEGAEEGAEQPASAQDYQLARALDLIRGLAIMSKSAAAK